MDVILSVEKNEFQVSAIRFYKIDTYSRQIVILNEV